MPYAINGSVRIWYEVFGNPNAEATILFLAGLGSDHSVWKAQVDALQGRFRIITVDHRGAGKSDRPERPYSADIMVADVRAVLEKEGVERFHLVGFSLGGLIAQKLFSSYPEMVSRLVLMNCSLGIGNPDTVLPQKSVINVFLFFAMLTHEDCSKSSVDCHFGPAFETEFPDEYKAFFDYTMQNSLGIPYQIPILMSDEIFLDLKTAQSVPVMVILGKEDHVTPPENGDAFRKHLPHAQIEFLEGHHASMLIHPREVNRLLEVFLASGQAES